MMCGAQSCSEDFQCVKDLIRCSSASFPLKLMQDMFSWVGLAVFIPDSRKLWKPSGADGGMHGAVSVHDRLHELDMCTSGTIRAGMDRHET